MQLEQVNDPWWLYKSEVAKRLPAMLAITWDDKARTTGIGQVTPRATDMLEAIRAIPPRPPELTPSILARPGSPVEFAGRLLVHPDDVARLNATAADTGNNTADYSFTFHGCQP